MTVADASRVVLVDDHMLLRQALRQLIDSEPDLQVVGEAGTSEDAEWVVGRTRPDVVLLDVEIPGWDTRTTMARLRSSSPASRVLVVSMHDDPELVRELLDLGVQGYINKSAGIGDLLSAIRTVHAGDGRVVISVSQRAIGHPDGIAGAVRLSDRETEILMLTARALSNAQIGARLSISEATVKRHLRNVFAKLGAVSRLDAVNKAIAASLIPSLMREPAPPDVRLRRRGAVPHQPT